VSGNASSANSGDEIAEVTKAGVAAALAVARDLGLPAEAPRLLSSRGNVLVHLAPAPVVARVATLTGQTRDDPLCWMSREIAAARQLSAAGAPVVAPAQFTDPGPHDRGGLAVSLWTLVPESASIKPSPAQAGVALARLHTAGRDFAGDLPLLAPIRDLIFEGLGILERDRVLDGTTIAGLRARHHAILAEIDAYLDSDQGFADLVPVLHGDAHPGNLLVRQGECVWIDLEETCRGPRAFDLAVLALTYDEQRASGARPASAIARLGTSQDAIAALTAYAGEAGVVLPDPAVLGLFARARMLEAVVWICGMARHYPTRYQAQARARLAALP
jgi:Phosphotransferase enzyme family